MRISEEKINFIKKEIRKLSPLSKIYLFGSRVDDNKKGGDLDILVLSDKKITLKEKIKIKTAFWKKYGIQKIDIVSFVFNENNTFKNIALNSSIEV